MNAMKNAAHLAALALWGIAGLLFTFKMLFAGGGVAVLCFWAWFAGFAAFTSWVVSKLEGPLATVGAHAGALLVLHVIPRVMPFSLLRVGLDLLLGNG